MRLLRVYDFDKTLYRYETSMQFYRFCIIQNPFYLFWIPWQLCTLMLYACRLISLEKLKSCFFQFLKGKKEEELTIWVEKFWKHQQRYLYDNVVKTLNGSEKEKILITASPEFLVAPLGKQLGFAHTLGTKMLFQEGIFMAKVAGKNCKREEKVVVLEKLLNGEAYVIEEFYSDSIADRPLFDRAKKKYWIDRGEIKEGYPQQTTFFDRLFSK